MDELSVEIVQMLNYLVPGFLTAWIFYGFTAYRRPSQFERIVQALVFNGIIQLAVIPIRRLLIGKANWHGAWTDEARFVTSWIVAVLLGLIIAWFAHRDWLHSAFRWMGLTANTSYPSQWYSAFKQLHSDVILNMKHGRRLRGWPFEWPDHPDEGQFRICDAKWLLDDGSEILLDAAECLVIPVTEVEFVEFIKCPKEDREQSADKFTGSCVSPAIPEQVQVHTNDQIPVSPEAIKTNATESRSGENGVTPDQHAEKTLDTSTAAEKVKGVRANVKANRNAKSNSRSKRR